MVLVLKLILGHKSIFLSIHKKSFFLHKWKKNTLYKMHIKKKINIPN